MSNLQRRLAGEDINLSTIPPGVNPFDYVTDIITPRYFIPLSISATVFLVVFFIFHLLISIFCLALLLLPYFRGIKQSQWLFRKLYIKDNSGTNVYNTPLYWVNAGILMTASQLIGSLGAQAFILIQILSADSVRYAIHSQLEPALGLMFIGEMLTYWSLLHCFLVAIYYDNKTHGDPTKHAKRWSPSPTLINSVFLGFPICIVAATIALFTWLCSAHKLFSTGAGQILDSLKQGSSVWDRLRVSSTESEELQLTTQLLQLTTQVTNLRQETSVHLDHVVHCFLILQTVLLVLLWITCLVSTLNFTKKTSQSGWILFKYQKSNASSGSASAKTSFFRRWLWPKISRDGIEEQTVSTTPSLYDMAKKDRQFFHLLVRSLGMIIAMMTMMVLFLLGIARTVDVVRSPYWRGVAAWLATASGTWSAFPITWQCWRLYKEELSGGSHDSANKNSSCKMDATHQNSVPPRPWDTDSADIEIKFLSPTTSASPTSHEP